MNTDAYDFCTDDNIIYHNWPIELAYLKRGSPLRWRSWFTWHGVQASARHYYWVYHLGPLKIIFGKRTAYQFRRHFYFGFTVALKADENTRRFWLENKYYEQGLGYD